MFTEDWGISERHETAYESAQKLQHTRYHFHIADSACLMRHLISICIVTGPCH